ncbi:hypothetical protein [Desulforhabdus sp. TSK]|uniref:hypothetical protein n=1 Tax=Desulforhabdus sp. TSK TaxID=2925014 RepID=UPI001FC7C35B|nr:hypothetical protein [Desulforhabdus sp. TSK]GKT10021.1 hypothetical protein DSTSK_33260 [Desulforhabdus sp. TSK]
MKIMIGFKASKEFKEFLQGMAKSENRTLSNFIVNALLTYIREHKGVEYRPDDESEES